MHKDKTEREITEEHSGGQCVCTHRKHSMTTLIGNKGWNRWEQRLVGLTM